MKYTPLLFAVVISISASAFAQSATTKTASLTMNQEEYTPDRPLNIEEQELVNRLSNEDLEKIDAQLLANCTNNWRKVAMIVGISMSKLKPRVAGIPDLFYAQRVIKLVHEGKLEADGNLQYMRFSEVRLPQK